MINEQEKRESREFWAVTEFGIRKTVGYSCAPGTPGYWWCPSIGISGNTEHHLFDTRKEALQKFVVESEKKILDLQALIKSVREQNEGKE